MQDKDHIVHAGLRYGLVGGVIAILVFLVLYLLKADPIDSIRFFDFVLIPIFVFFAIKELRDYRFDNRMAYWQGMSVGAITYGIIAVCSSLFIWFMLTVISPDTFEQHRQKNIEMLTEEPQKWIDEIGEGPYNEAVQDLRQLTTLEIALDDFLKKLLIGLFLTSFISIFLKKTNHGTSDSST